MSDEPESEESGVQESDSADEAIVLDYLARGDSDADRQQFRRSPVAFAVRPADFALFALALSEDADVSIGDRVLEELQQTDLKYRNFVDAPPESGS